MSGDAAARSDCFSAGEWAGVGTCCVYKIGGSLLSLPDLAQRIARLIRDDSSSRPLLVVGGGLATDLVREWDRVHGLGDEWAHRLAVGAMSLNAQLVAALLNGSRLVTSLDEARGAWECGEIAVVEPEQWLNRYEGDSAAPLSRSWSVTSDSIAAWIALQIGAERLMLAKSVKRPGGDLQLAARSGYVDPAFPALAARLPCIEWVNLRNNDAKGVHWQPQKPY